MSHTRFSPPDLIEHDVRHYKGLLLAAALKPESVKLLLGCTTEEAKMFGDEARYRRARLHETIRAAKRV